jgi:hypothetical protein
LETGLPLLNWQKQVEHHRLQEKREQLLARIAKLRPHAMKRVELEIQVREVTRRQMELEIQLDNRSRGGGRG